MLYQKANIIAQLQKDILPLQGFKPVLNHANTDIGLGGIKDAFPNHEFPLGAIHEFIAANKEDAAATGGFIAGILGALMQRDGVIIWISSSRTVFPPALRSFGIDPGRIIFIDLPDEKHICWVMEETLKCDGLSAVVGELRDIDFTSSRRLQLAVEQSRVTGFVIRCNPPKLSVTACISRWKISSVPSVPAEDMPGVGFPRWKVELLKVRNGKPGSWDLEWRGGKFSHPSIISEIHEEQHTKTG